MRRREFISLLGGAAVAWPFAARAQQAATPVIGYLGASSPELFASRLRAFRHGLSENGYVEGRNVAIEYRWAEGRYDRIPALIADLVRHQVSVIAAPGSTPAALAAKAATTTIPIVFVTGIDPVAAGLVGSLNRPGGNLTGVVALSLELGPKQMQLLHEIVPTAKRIALLVNPDSPTLADKQTSDQQATARALGLELHILHARAPDDFDTVFANLGRLRAGGLIIGGEALFTSAADRLATLALHHAMPALYLSREFPAAGGLMSYGPSIADGHRLAGVYASRILKGEKPAELPVQQSTKIDLVINLKTANALGLTVPLPLLARADEVIE
jgi:putative tryptophan/tyrosine transport system substrate-binding protein